VILTAAHCLRDDKTGQWWNNFAFALQYDRGRYSRLYGWECVATKQGWVTGDDDFYAWDIGMILANGNSATGEFGYSYGWNPQAYPTASKIGYPVDILDGSVIQVDAGRLFKLEDEDNIVGLNHGNRRSLGGSSGGAWVGRYSNTVGQSNYAISVTSHYRIDDPSIMYGPYFTQTSFRSLLDYTTRGCK
jgi:hypothetical protein